jgi:signal transduction histidine kinase
MERPGTRNPARWTWWAASSGLALLAASQWLHAPSVEYLVATLIATAASFALVTRVDGAQRWWAAACSVMLATATGFAIPAQISLWQVNHDWDDWRVKSVASGLTRLRGALDAALVHGADEANRALDVPRERAAAFDALGALDRGNRRDERGIILFTADSAFAWAGMTRVHVENSREGIGVAGTPFYLAVTRTAERADRRATSVTLVDAAPPADRLSAPLAPRIARDAGLSAFLFGPPTDSGAGPELMHYAHAGVRLFDVRSAPLVQSTVAFRITERVRVRAGLAFLLALACFIIGVWRGTRTLTERLAALAVALACTALVPLSQYSNLTRLFDPGVYFTRAGGPLTGNAGALATTGALVLLGILAVFRRRGRPVSRWIAAATVLLVAGLGPFLLRDLARGIHIPTHGVNASLWLIWEIPIFLAAVSVLLAGAGAGAIVLGRSRGLPPFMAPAAAGAAALIAPVVWEAPGQWPWWYTFLWIGAIGMLALSRQTRFVVLSAATVAALGATTLVWGRTARGRVALAENDLAGLSEVDPNLRTFLSRFGASLADDASPITRQDLLKQYVVSEIAAAGNPTSMSAWPTDSGPVAIFETAPVPLPRDRVAQIVARARATRQPQIETVPTEVTLEMVLAAPGADGGVTAAIVAPRSRLFDVDPFSRLLGLDVETEGEPPYTLRLREATPRDTATGWRREMNQLHGDQIVRTGTRAALAHVEIELRSLSALVQRGALITLLDLALVALLWLVSVVADGGAARWLRARRLTWGRSYRARLSIALFAFFVIPAAAFGVWSYGRIATDANRSRALLVNETLRSVVPPADTTAWLADESDRLDSPLFLYSQGELRAASDPMLEQLAPVGRLVDPAVEVALTVRDEESVTRTKRVDGSTTLFGFRAFDAPAQRFILSAPARADELSLGRGRRDLGILVLFATAVGALAALWLSGIAARQLERPIRTLRQAALSIAGGERLPPLEGEPTVEFRPVFTAFRRMAEDLNASRTALEEVQRRTAAVLRNVASGVIAIDTKGDVSLANPRAEALLERPLPSGTRFDDAAPERLAALVSEFLHSADEDAEFELEIEQQQLRGRLTRLGPGGAVVTLDDVTDLARAQRVLAWGEMARQIAHEIKNPLTPIRLGVQHLRRARADTRVDFDRVLEHNVNQILAEIDRLDEIARAFSRYGSAPEDRPAAVPTDVSAVVREVVALERMGDGGGGGGGASIQWVEAGVDSPRRALARTDELKEVLLNVLENARLAGATRVHVQVDGDRSDDGNEIAIAVRDNGHGIPADVMPRIFEPHFSTRTSGSGLGLAISRQIVEGWGGGIAVHSATGSGTTVTIRLRAAG